MFSFARNNGTAWFTFEQVRLVMQRSFVLA